MADYFDADVPDTLKFIDPDYPPHPPRYQEQVIVVFGGSSGIGFAAAAQFVQECAQGVVLVARNDKQLNIASKVLRSIDRSHCIGQAPAKVHVIHADVRKRNQVQHAFRKVHRLFPFRDIDVVMNTAGISGYVGVGVGEIPDDIFFSKFDAVFNNLYGALYITAEAIRSWNSTVFTTNTRVPVLITLASEEALSPCPGCALYGVSKAGIVGLFRAVSEMYEDKVRAHIIAPGLVDTPMTWNQVRGSRINERGEYEQVDEMQAYQCYKNKTERTIIEDGTCKPFGGTGYGCPCPDVSASDPRIPLKFGEHLYPPIDPRTIGRLALFLGSVDGAHLSGNTFIVDNNFTMNSTHHQLRDCPKSMVALCPVVDLDHHDEYLASDRWVLVVFGFVLGVMFSKLQQRGRGSSPYVIMK